MKCRRVLLEIREKRARELEEYEKLCSNIGGPQSEINKGLIEKRKSILTLELPFQSDAVSVNSALVKEKGFYQQNGEVDPREVFDDSLCKCIFSKHSTDDRAKKEFIKGLFDELRPEVVFASYDQDKKKIVFTGPEEVPFEDLNCCVCRQEIFKRLEQLMDGCECKESTKKRYRAYLKQMLSLVHEANVGTQLPVSNSCSVARSISVKALATYFEYLEQRCLTSFSIDAYYDLVALRLIFYVHIEFKQLESMILGCFKGDMTKIHYAGQDFQLPKSFGDLACSFIGEGDSLLRRTSKSLNQFVAHSSLAAGLKKSINPTRIRNSLKAICQLEGFVAKYLPSR